MRPAAHREGVVRACAVLVVAVTVSLTAGFAAASGPALASDGHGRVVSLTATKGQLEAVVAATDLAQGATLDRSSIVVTVDGRPVRAAVQPLSQVDHPLPVRRAMLVVDTSGSMKGPGIAAARDAAHAFVAAAPADVEIGVVAFDDRARVLVPPTRDRDRVRAAIGQLSAEAGNTSLYDGVVLAAGQLGAAAQRSIVVLSDGADNRSAATMDGAVAAIAGKGIRLDLVAFRTKGSEQAILRQLAGRTGGRVGTAADAAALAGAFTAAARSFDTQVILTAALPPDLTAGSHTVAVSLLFGSKTITATGGVDVPAGPPASAGVPRAVAGSAPSGPGGVWMWVVLGVVFLALLALAVAAFVPLGESAAVRRARQLDLYARPGARRLAARKPDASPGEIAQSILEFSDRIVAKRGLGDTIALQLDRADMRLRPNEWLVLRACVAMGSVAVLTLATNVLLGIVVGIPLAWLGTHVYVAVRAARRLKAFEEFLPDTLQLVASGLQTGFSLPQALDGAVKDGRQPIAGELGRAISEARLGAPLEDALDRVADRMDSQDFRWTIMAVRIQRQVGGNLAEVLQTTVHTMRERGYLRRQVRTLSAEGRLSAYILVALPVGLFCYLFAFRRPYISLLWTHPIGIGMSVLAGVLMTVGTLWMRKTVKVEV